MQPQITALGYHVRFVPPSLMDETDRFYGDLLALPRITRFRIANGNVENKDFYWAGEAIVLNHNCGAPERAIDPREADPATARQVQIHRVSDLDGIVGRLRGKGATVSPIAPAFHGREAFVRDPMGMLIGLRESDAGSPLAHDIEAARRRRRGETFNPGCARMPDGVQELGWERLRVSDVPAMTAFYRDVIGLPVIAASAAHALFDFGDNSALELVPGGQVREIPPAQKHAGVAMIVRTNDLAAFRQRFRDARLVFVHEVYASLKGDLFYIADPDGNVVAFTERHHPGAYVGRMPMATEDLEAGRRWAELVARRAET